MRNILLIILFNFASQIVNAQFFYKEDLYLLENDSLKKSLFTNFQSPIISDLDEINSSRANKISKFTSFNILSKENKNIKNQLN